MESQSNNAHVEFYQELRIRHFEYSIFFDGPQSSSKPNTTATDIKPLYSFEGADDYVYDVKWSPNHPALFGSVDGTGKFSLWNLNVDTEVGNLSLARLMVLFNKIHVHNYNL